MPSAPSDPLIAASALIPSASNDTDTDADSSTISSDLAPDAEVDETILASPTPFIWALTLSACISGLLFGYDTGVISSTLVSIGSDLSARPLSTLEKSLITSSTSLFALLASPLTGILADAVGRRPVILAADLLFVLGAVWQAGTASVAGMVCGRAVVGAAVGCASCVVPVYISELAPGPFRGRMVVVSALFITGGQVVAYVVGWGFSGVQGGWRWMVGLGAVPAVVQVVMLWFMPETPRWLVRVGRKSVARRVLGRVYGGATRHREKRLVGQVLRRIEREVLEEQDLGVGRAGKDGWGAKVDKVWEDFRHLVGVGGNRRALVIACLLQGAQQLCGFNALMYFSATIFSLVGFRSPTLASLSIALTNFAFTLVAFHYIDRIGRRRILLLSMPVMILGLALCAVAFNFLDWPTEAHGMIGVVNTDALSDQGKVWPLIILIAMVTYVAGYASGLGNVPWQQSELFPLSVRSLGSALATTTNWASNTLIGLTFLPMMEFLTPVVTFALYAVICALALGAIYRIYPETAGLSLEDVGGLLKDGWGVKASVEKAKARRRVVDG